MAVKKKRVSRKSGDEPPSAQASPGTTGKKLAFDYIKSYSFRVIHVDGVHGCATPKADGIQMAFFSERMAIPTREEYAVSEEGRLKDRIRVEKRNAVVREVEVEAILSIDIARRLETWLHKTIEEAEKVRKRGRSNG